MAPQGESALSAVRGALVISKRPFSGLGRKPAEREARSGIFPGRGDMESTTPHLETHSLVYVRPILARFR